MSLSLRVFIWNVNSWVSTALKPSHLQTRALSESTHAVHRLRQ